ncbi:MAG: hypothetical protein QM647_00440 [Asticcacaulis sp.]|uniref:hypothetical protein n=1 Tax=Asticcacaulis sp. TaxID=1872648 RepID=UPI0039E4CEBC
MSWFINLLTGLIALLISAAMAHFGGDSRVAPPVPSQVTPPPASAPDNARPEEPSAPSADPDR